MRKSLRIAAVLSVFVAMIFGISIILAARGGRPAPPPPVLCGCACPDGSFVIVHAPTGDDCPSACATACAGSETF